jgi:site-specific DNA recombinase
VNPSRRLRQQPSAFSCGGELFFSVQLIEADRVDVVVVYKIYRLSRSLIDFTKLIEVFDRHGVTFVSVTQSFCTTTSMGRLTLNILLSFAQFEREMTGERIRDKIAASKKKGMWMGGYAPFGYFVQDRKLVVEPTEAALVRSIFQRFTKLGSATKLVKELRAEGVRNRYGKLFDKGSIYRLLNKCTYVGEVLHKGTIYPGEHAAIVDRGLWDKVHAILKESPRVRGSRNRASTPAILKGLIFNPSGAAMTPTHTRKHGRLYRYYVTNGVIRGSADACPIRRVPAAEIEAAVLSQINVLVQSPEIIVATWKAAKQTQKGLTEQQVREHLIEFAALWSELFPAEQARLIQLLVARVQITTDGVDVTLRTDGLASLVHELRPKLEQEAA